MLDTKRLIAEVAARNSIRVDPDDPAFALVTLNQLVLEETARQLHEEIRASIVEFERSVQKVETRAGKILGERVREAATEFSSEIHSELSNASSKIREIAGDAQRANSRGTLVRSIAIALFSGLGFFVAGLWIGVHIIR